MRRVLKRFRNDTSGVVLIEYTLVFVMLMVLTFGLIEFGIVLYQYNAAEKATAVGARFAATRGPVVTGVSDCGVATGAAAGTPCSAVNGSAAWSLVCNASAPAAGCNTVALNELVTAMQAFAPGIEAQNVQVEWRGAGLGFVGRGSPVPLVTVRLIGMRYDFIALDDLLGFGTLTMPGFDATVVGEDVNEGMGSS